MDALNVSLFGRLTIRWADGELVNLATPRVQELFCYLVLQRDQAHSREILFDLFWRNSSPSQARRNLRQTLWQLQRIFDVSESCSAVRLVRTCTTWVQINPDATLQTDVATFEQAFALVNGVPADHMNPQQAQVLQSAVALYRGDLLEGWYQDWCLVERERLQNKYLAMLDKLMCFCEARQMYDIGLDYGKLVLRYDRANERAHRRIISLFYLSGNRTAALNQYENCVAALQEELDVGPSARTTTLYQQICADTLDARPHADMAAPLALDQGAGGYPLVGVLDSLRQMWATVAMMQGQLQQEIQTIEKAIAEWHG
jgi:DNA-binding SARP family transcriptional activator